MILISLLICLVVLYCSMESSSVSSAAASTAVDAMKAVRFMNIVGKLKLLKRTGWVNNGKFLVLISERILSYGWMM